MNSARKESLKRNWGWLVVGMLLGAVSYDVIFPPDSSGEYQRGYADAIEKCVEPSRLEKAAKWMAR